MRTCVFSRLGAMESISSMKMMEGAFFSASSKAFRKLLSLSPASLLMISGPLIRKKKAPVSLATALAIRVFPARQHSFCHRACPMQGAQRHGVVVECS